MKELSKPQAEAIKAFRAAQKAAKESIVNLARKYQACLGLGVDMREYGIKPSSSLHFRLVKIAAGKLLPEAHERLLANHSLVKVMAALPIRKQQTILSKGVTVVRGNAVHTLPVEDISPGEARRISVTTGGNLRLAEPHEQRTHRNATRQCVAFWVQPREYRTLSKSADAAGQTIAEYVRECLRDAGVLDSGSRHRRYVKRHSDTRLHA